jgi:putative ABC transport system permease protein
MAPVLRRRFEGVVQPMKRSLRSWLWRVPLNQEIDDELELHVEMRTRELIARGVDPKTAREQALQRLGDISTLKRTMTDLGRKRDREMRLTLWFEELADDLKFSFRQLKASPSFTVIATLTLALGIGANSAIFALVDATVLRPLPYAEPDRLVSIWEHGETIERGYVSPLNMLDWETRGHSFEKIAGFTPAVGGMVMAGMDGNAETVSRQWVSAEIFNVLGVKPIAGRTFTSDDDRKRANVIVLSEGFWRTRFNADQSVISREIRLDGALWTVVGVLPRDFELLGQTSIWAMRPITNLNPRARGAHLLQAVGRLKTGVSVKEAEADISAVADALAREYPQTNKGRGVAFERMHDSLVGRDLRRTSMLFLGVVGFVLLICCVNVANLLLARAAEREREFALRAALGASRGRLMRQLLTESMLLAALGGALGLLIGANGMRALTALLSGAEAIPRLDDLRFDWQAFAFTAAVSLATGLLFGLVPAIRAARPDLQEALKEGGRGAASSRRVRRMGNLLVIGEVALAMLLLVGAGLIVQSFIRLQLTDPGFATGRMLTIKVNVPDYKYGRTTNASRPGSQEFVSRIKLFRLFEERLNSLPGIESAAVSERLPVGQWPGATGISIDGRAPVADELWGCAELRQNGLPCHGAVGVNSVSAAYFRTIGMRLIRGRLFDERDTADTQNVALISETAARKYWPDEDPVGKSFMLNFSSWFPKAEIIGVVSDIKTAGLDMPPYPEIYRPDSQLPSDDCHLIIRTKAAPESLAATVREEMGRIDRDIPLRGVGTMEDLIAGTLWRARLSAWLLGLFAALAAALAAAGLYGVMSYAVSQRRQELGLRMALGAEAGDVMRLVVGAGIKLTFMGLALGLIAAFALSRFIVSQLFGVTATDPLTYAGAAMLLAMAALIACYLPAHRAAKVDPLQALRHE